MDRPAKDGAYQTAWRRLKEREAQGGWEKLWRRPLEWGDREKKRSRKGVGVEATTGEAQKMGEGVGFDGDRRRKGTKVHAVVTAQGAPVGVEGTSAPGSGRRWSLR